jgi:hypothetical protein
VTDSSYMFYNSKAFDQDITGWSTPSNCAMGNMFKGASAFTAKFTREGNKNNGPASAWHLLSPPPPPPTTPPSPLEPDSEVTYSYEYIGEGRCEDYGMTAIANKEECRLAGATVDGHPEKPIREDARIRDRPGPCLIHKFQRNSATRPTEWFPSGQQACTAKGSGYDCICKKPTSAADVTYIKLQYKGTSNGLCASIGSSNAGSAGCATSETCKDNGKSDLTLQTCNDNDDFQLWNLEGVADDDGYVFHSKADPTRCMYTGSSPAHGGCEPFTLTACDTSDTRQVFKQEAYGDSSIWRNVATNLAIDVNAYRNSVDNWVWGCGGRNSAKKFDAIVLSPPEPK